MRLLVNFKYFDGAERTYWLVESGFVVHYNNPQDFKFHSLLPYVGKTPAEEGDAVNQGNLAKLPLSIS